MSTAAFLQRGPSRFHIALSVSLLAHALLLSISLGGHAFGLPGLNFPWKERRLGADDLSVVLAPAPAPVSAETPKAAPVPVDKSMPAKEVVPASMPQPVTRDDGAVVAMPPAPVPEPVPAPVTEPIPAPAPAQVMTARTQPDPVSNTASEEARKQEELDRQEQALRQIMLEREKEDAELARQGELLAQAQREAAQREAAQQEQLRQEQLRQEQLRLDGERAELARQEELRREALQQERDRQDALAQQEAARQERERAEAAQREVARVEAAQREVTRQEQARQAQLEAARQAQQEAARLDRERERAEAAQREVAQREAAQREAAQREAAQREAAQREAAQREAAQREAAQREAAQREAAQREAAQREAAQREAAQREAAQQEAARQEQAKQDQAQRERAAQEAQREERLRAIGQQLDKEAAQREPLPPGASSLRRGWLFGRADPNADLVLYAQAMSRKIELNMTFDTVREAVKQPHTAPVVTMAIRADGSVEKVTFVVSSGVPAIDEAVRKVIASQAPYPAFSPALARQYDVIEIRRTWIFDMAIRLQ